VKELSMATWRAFLFVISSFLPLFANASEAEFYYGDAENSMGVWSVKSDKICAVQIYRGIDLIWYGNLSLNGEAPIRNAKLVAFAVLSKYVTFPDDFRGTVRLKFLRNKEYTRERLEFGAKPFPHPSRGMLAGYVDREELLKALSQNDQIEYEVDDARGESTGIKRTYGLRGAGAANVQFLKCEAFVGGELND
jgi:hypothetical protein